MTAGLYSSHITGGIQSKASVKVNLWTGDENWRLAGASLTLAYWPNKPDKSISKGASGESLHKGLPVNVSVIKETSVWSVTPLFVEKQMN